jgi:acyl carrier protein
LTRDEFRDGLLRFINGELLAGDAPPVDADTHLFGGDLLNSLRLIHLLAFVEDALDRTIPDEEIVMDRFATVNDIARSFWPEGAA